MMDERLIYEILSVVAEIPPGRVATYGQIARLTGREKNARLVGKILSTSQQYGEYPCHRVVNREGGLSDAFQPGGKETHRLLLLAEGVLFCADGSVDLARCLWEREAQRTDG